MCKQWSDLCWEVLDLSGLHRVTLQDKKAENLAKTEKVSVSQNSID